MDRELNYGRKQIQALVKSLDNVGVALDIGAGPGQDLRGVRQLHPHAILKAVEWDLNNCLQLEGLGATTHQCDLERDKLPCVDGEVDLLIANQILEHCKEIFWIFHEISRVTKIGGRAIIGIPNLASAHNRALLLAGRQPTQIRTASAHVRGFTLPDLHDFLGTCAPGTWIVRRVKGANFYPLPSKLAQVAARLFPRLSWGLIIELEKSGPYTTQFLEYPTISNLETNFYVGE